MDSGAETNVTLTLSQEEWSAKCGDVTVDARILSRAVLYAPRRTAPPDGRGDAALRVIAGHLAAHARSTGSRVLTWERDEDASWNAALFSAGLVEHRRKLFVERDLTRDLPSAGEFDWRTLEDVGEDVFLATLIAASDGDPFEEGGPRDHAREWRELVQSAGAALDPNLWRIARVADADADAGIVLPTAFSGKDARATISYIGVLPALRGRGLGRRLHAAGLALLAAAGARTYMGSTDVRNVAMSQIFERNGCSVSGVQLFLR